MAGVKGRKLLDFKGRGARRPCDYPAPPAAGAEHVHRHALAVAEQSMVRSMMRASSSRGSADAILRIPMMSAGHSN